MPTLVASVLILVTLRYAHLVADRGSREHLLWARMTYRYIKYIVSLDQQGSLIRDAAIVTDNIGMRRKLGLRAYVLFGLIVLIVMCTGLFNWSPYVIAAMCVALSNIGYLANRLLLRVRGHIDYAVSYNLAQKTLIVLATAFAIVLSWVGFYTYISISFSSAALSYRDILARWAIVIGSLSLAPAAYTMVYRVMASLVPPDFAQTTSSSSILLLRSFSDDRLRMRNPLHADPFLGMLGTRATLEQCLASFVIGDGDLVAIGKPGERLPRLGALRTYWPDDRWQEAVRNTAALAQAVFLIAGSTQGLSWEVQQLKHLGLLPKTIFFVPPLPKTAAEKRLEQLLNDLDAPEAAFIQARACIGSTVIAVRITSDERIVLHLSNGRDWASYLGTSTYFLGELSGKIRPPAVGEIAKNHLGTSSTDV